MPPGSDPTREKSLQEIVDEVNRYPIEAFLFLQQALGYAVNLVHAELSEVPDANVSRHITGQQLCEGLRAYALAQWGMLARVVLARWGITSTLDFGRIVFALVDAGHMAKTDTDTIEDFRDVYDFQTAFDSSYQIGSAL
jgi:uncharacterized repeat protein (TIGR04138 family)